MVELCVRNMRFNAQRSALLELGYPVLDGILNQRLNQHHRHAHLRGLGRNIPHDVEPIGKAQPLERQVVIHHVEFARQAD